MIDDLDARPDPARMTSQAMMDLERESTVPRYRLCSVGYLISGIALGLLSLSGALMLWVYLTVDQRLFAAMQQPWFTWGVELPITGGALLGSYLLWGRWTDAAWQRRVGLLVILNLFDAISWGLSQAQQLGVPIAVVGNEWLLFNVVMLFGWVEFYLFADLAAEVASHLGMRAAPDAGRTARQFSAAGLVLSTFYFATQTRWDAGWPLVPGPIGDLAEALMTLGVTFLRVIAALQVASLCMIAWAACRRTARELVAEEEMAGAAHFDASGTRESEPGKGPSDEEFPW
jgi:hypothetical protein